VDTVPLTSLARAGGCAAKYAAASLETVLAGLVPADADDLLVGLDPADDAAVYRLDDERALVFTVDFFPPLVDDARTFGAIAATNALNDVFAMGGKPLLALSIAAFPEELPVEQLGEVLRAGDTIRVAKGGRGGRGNARFATPTHQAPREWEPGEEGEQRSIELVLKLIADVGLVGEPNAGKSTLLSVISAARPKIADYPFTTLEPNLGVVGLSGHRSFVLADIPGIIEGAHQGKGLGLRFLQHVERTRVLAYLIPLDSPDPQGVYDRLRHEVGQYSDALAATPHVALLTKRDLLPAGDPVSALRAPEAAGILTVSSVAGTGLEELKEYLWKFVEAAKSEEAPVEAWGEEGPE